MANRAQPSALKLAFAILALFIVGTPIVAYLWQTLNTLMAGHIEARRLLIAVPVFALLLLLLVVTARVAGSTAAGQQATLHTKREQE